MEAARQQNSQVAIQEYPKLLTESKALLTHIGKIIQKTPNLKRIEEYGNFSFCFFYIGFNGV